MQINISAIFKAGDEDSVAIMIAKLKDLGLDYEPRDEDGRRWIRVSGMGDVGDLTAILGHLTNLILT